MIRSFFEEDTGIKKIVVNARRVLNKNLNNPLIMSEICEKLSEEDSDEIVIESDFNIIYDNNLELLKDFVKKVNDKNAFENPVRFCLVYEKEGNKTKLGKEIIKLRKKDKKLKEADIYNLLFVPRVLPDFIHSRIKDCKGKEIEKYSVGNEEVKIIKTDNGICYKIHPEEYSLYVDEVKLLVNAFDLISKKEFDIEYNTERKRTISKVKNLVKKEFKKINEKLLNILLTYSVGYGVIEHLFKDPNLEDIFIDSPSDKEVYVMHSKYGLISTNLILSKKDLEKIATKLRSLSGRPFDEGHPVIDTTIEEYDLRVCGIKNPLTFNGIGFAFRKHRTIPWNMIKFIKNKMINYKAAGFLEFILNSNASILITGPRGSGKTSLLGGLLTEINTSNRFIIIEDTNEILVDKLRKNGFRIQHIKTNPEKGYELSPEQALRTALRLGESVLVIGEVRGEEAKTLFEAMRVGAAGNVVLGTIHGNTAYDTWDRIVNDLGVPSTSFKAADIVISCANLNIKGKKVRRVISITEIKKEWQKDPFKENGLLELMKYDPIKDELVFTPQFKNSYLLKRQSLLQGKTITELKEIIEVLGKKKKIMCEVLEKEEDNLKKIIHLKKEFNKCLEKTRFNHLKALSMFKKISKKNKKA